MDVSTTPPLPPGVPPAGGQGPSAPVRLASGGHSPGRRERQRFAALATGALVLAAGALALAACGSSASSATAKATTAGSTGGSSGFQAFRTCLSQHGVTVPSFPHGTGSYPHGTGSYPQGTRPTSFPAGGYPHTPISESPAMAQAMKDCGSLRPSGGGPGHYYGGGAGAPASANVNAYVGCLSTHGVSIPAGSSGTAALSGVNRTSAAFEAANAACAHLLTGGPSSGSTTSTTASGA